ncbi:MAG: prepilin peptidase [Cellulosilyticum sp.]|nr:prepilin peptidase [Cellulosilyticum sp.]
MGDWIIIALLGITVGSFLNVCIDRIPVGESIIYPRSHCMSCGHILGALELIPILSYLGLKGRCKKCQHKIVGRSIGVEAITGVGFVGIYSYYGRSMEMLIMWTFFAVTLILTIIDWKKMLLPTCVIKWGLIIGMVEKLFQVIELGHWQNMILSLLGAIVGYGIFAILYSVSKRVLKKEGLGYGDVRLVGLIGFFVGVQNLFMAIFIAALLASIYGAFLLKKKRLSEPYPFGPFLSIGSYTSLLWGTQIMNWYIGQLK